jgi:FlaA1/EpsC-like NDP-sugar epimerase
MVETILITGATGTVGGEVIRQLVGINSEVSIKTAGHSLQKLEKLLKMTG